ncbi:MAG: putative dehydrogenase [Candidatus Latescibacterota bacterium]|jgi:predicted dehydrogenase
MDKIRVGVIGCGMVAKSYLNTLQKFAHIEFGACADLMPERAEQIAAEYHFKRACSPDELLAGDDCDLVLNLTIPAAHCEVNLAILEAGKHVYSEKPLGIKLHEAEQVLAKAKEKGLRVGCAPDTFLAGAHQHCRQLIETGSIGQAVAAFGTVCGHGPDAYHANPHFFYEEGAGPMLDQGVYVITALLPLLGRVKTVSARAQIGIDDRTVLSEPRFGEKIEVKTPTHLVCALEYEGGGMANLMISWEIWASRLPPMEIYGSEGTIRLPHWNNYEDNFDLYKKEKDGGDWENIQTHRPYVGGSYRGLGMAEMAAAILTNKPHRASGERANHVLDIMEGLVRSSQEDRPIDMTTPYEKPEIFADGLEEGQIDHLSA